MSRLAPAATAADLQLDGTNLTLVFAVLAIAIIALVMGVFFRQQVLAADPGTEKMQPTPPRSGGAGPASSSSARCSPPPSATSA